MKKIIVAGNWKMNTTIQESLALINELKKIPINNEIDVIIFPPFTALHAANEAVKGSSIRCGSQTLSEYDSGAYTGEISGSMIRSIGSTITLIGHSERRRIFNESNETINKKMHQALSQSFDVMLCVGETLDERETNQTNTVLAQQLTEGLRGIEQLHNISIAYEPVWAIGTGITASPDQAEMAHTFISEHLAAAFGSSHIPPIVYGGSVSPKNISELIVQPHVDGVLVGGASLKSDSFGKIITICQTEKIAH